MEFKRNCPECGVDIKYSTKYTLRDAIKWNSKCRKCRGKDNFNKMHNKMKSGEIKYGFAGKNHSEESKKRISESTSLAYLEGRLDISGKSNPMYGKSNPSPFKGKSLDDIHGKDKAALIRKKLSIASSGKNNAMYGKPSPMGSGNGWSGWYKGWYFRSIKELSYMVLVIERFNIPWENGELKKYEISYTINGKNRTYRPDFILNYKYMIECKPKSLWNSYEVSIKTKAAIDFCEKNGLVYKLIDPIKLSDDDIKTLRLNNSIKFLDRYEKKFNDL